MSDTYPEKIFSTIFSITLFLLSKKLDKCEFFRVNIRLILFLSNGIAAKIPYLLNICIASLILHFALQLNIYEV